MQATTTNIAMINVDTTAGLGCRVASYLRITTKIYGSLVGAYTTTAPACGVVGDSSALHN